MASSEKNQRRDSKEYPPNFQDALSSICGGIKLLTSLVNSNLSELQAQIDKLSKITDNVENYHWKATAGSLLGGVVGAVGGITSIVGTFMAPVTLGASLSLTALGTGVAVLGGAAAATSNMTDMIYQKNSREEIETCLNTFKEKLSPITECLKDIQLNLDQQRLQTLAKLTGGLAGTLLLDVLDDISLAALKVSKSVGKVAGIIGVISGLSLVLDIFFIYRDVKELNKKTESETHQFIQKMRETIKTLQETLDTITSTNESLNKLPISK